MEKKKLSAFEYAVNLLAAREHSQTELFQKMRRKDYPADEINSALAECRRLGYQDDRHFALAMTDMLQSSGRGERVIRQKLIQRGISREIISETLAGRPAGQSDEEAAEIAVASRINAWNREGDVRKRREKMLRFLLGRGFQFSLALKIIDRLSRKGGES